MPSGLAVWPSSDDGTAPTGCGPSRRRIMGNGDIDIMQALGLMGFALSMLTVLAIILM